MLNARKPGQFAVFTAGLSVCSVPFWLLAACLFQVCTPHTVLAQKTGGGSTSSGGGAASGGTGGFGGTRTTGNGAGTYGNSGSFPNSSNDTLSNRPVFLSGRVMFDDGSKPNSEIRIERVCRSGSPRLEAHTDSKGRFSFQFGQNEPLDLDAGDAAGGGFGRPGSQQTQSTRGAGALSACELRAVYPGYRSDIVDLSTRRSLDDPDLGTIVLHHLGNVQGTTISLTSALAPKHAKKEYDKGMQQVQKGKDEEAEKSFLAATDEYPKYAEAWFALGELQARGSHFDGAQKSFQAAVAADPKYVSPYDQMALLAAKSGKWQDAADYSMRVIQLNPVEFPASFWYNAIANYNLSKPGEAEKSAKELLKVDTQHHFPEAENLYAQLMLDRGNYPEAAAHLRTYVTLVPAGKNTEAAKKTLAKLDEANAQAKKQ